MLGDCRLTVKMSSTLVLTLVWSVCLAVETHPAQSGAGVETLLRQLLMSSSAQCEVAIRENAVLRQRLRDLGQESFM
jgi:hypothetical protein